MTPTTEAGRQFVKDTLVGRRGTARAIVVIEREAVAAERARLLTAIDRLMTYYHELGVAPQWIVVTEVRALLEPVS